MRDNTIYFNVGLPFIKKGLQGIASKPFQNRNLLIGKNGSGKTRFLNALREELHANPIPDTTTVILDFPSLHAATAQAAGEAGSELYSILFSGDSADFSEFLNLVAHDNSDFILDLINTQLTMRAANPRKHAKDSLKGINSHIRDLIGYEIIFDSTQENRPRIRKVSSGRELPYNEMLAEFSPGEQFIFYLCFFLYYVDTVKQGKLILLMDEPEIHLHPQVLIKVIKWLYQSPVVEQLWVASHSLFLVPIFHFQEISLFDNNTLRPRDSKMYKQVYNDLVGLEDIGLFEMLKSMDNWAYYQFIADCFCTPRVVGKANEKDEQFQLFMRKAAGEKSDKPLRVLDYGAGKFRLWECLQLGKEAGEKTDRVIYDAYEPYPDPETVNWNKKQYGKSMFSLYTKSLQVPKHAYDAVVLMNVLHEIDIVQWQETFQQIHNALKPDGILIFQEVQTLTLGEQPFGNTGYLILGADEVNALFGQPIPLEPRIKTGDKSNCWAIPSDIVGRIDRAAIKRCLQVLIENSKKTLKEQFAKKLELAHSGKPVSELNFSAREYAFWSQQYINALLASERFDESVSAAEPFAAKQEPPKIIFPGLNHDTILQ